jgi:hypothetical protein
MLLAFQLGKATALFCSVFSALPIKDDNRSTINEFLFPLYSSLNRHTSSRAYTSIASYWPLRAPYARPIQIWTDYRKPKYSRYVTHTGPCVCDDRWRCVARSRSRFRFCRAVMPPSYAYRLTLMTWSLRLFDFRGLLRVNVWRLWCQSVSQICDLEAFIVTCLRYVLTSY